MRALVLLGLLGCTAPTAAPPAPGALLVSDYRANAILRYDGATGAFLGTFAEGSAQRVDRPAGVRVGPDNQLYAAGFGRGDVVRYDLTTGRMMDVFYWDTRLLEEPVELIFDARNLVILGNDTNNIVVLNPDGSLARTFGYPLLQNAHDFVIDSNRHVLVATDTKVQVWDLASGTQLGVFGERDLQRATSIAMRDDTIYVADWDRDCIMTFPEGRVLVAGLRDPISVDFFGDVLYVLDADGVQRFDPDTGELLGTLVARDQHMQWPRAFTFVAEIHSEPIPAARKMARSEPPGKWLGASRARRRGKWLGASGASRARRRGKWLGASRTRRRGKWLGAPLVACGNWLGVNSGRQENGAE